jgi:hypothetical protein
LSFVTYITTLHSPQTDPFSHTAISNNFSSPNFTVHNQSSYHSRAIPFDNAKQVRIRDNGISSLIINNQVQMGLDQQSNSTNSNSLNMVPFQVCAMNQLSKLMFKQSFLVDRKVQQVLVNPKDLKVQC